MIRAKHLLILSLLLVFPVSALGQQTSGVTGVVTDAAGALVNGAEVKLTDSKTNKELSTKTNEQGVYYFNKVSPGIGYRLTFSAQGFDTMVLNNVTLGVGVMETHNAQLSVGQVTNTVTVTSSGEATLNTTDASIGNVIDQRRLHDLPIQLRNSPAALLGLQPGVVGNNVGTATTNRVGSVTGSRADQGNITVDGIDANDQATQQAFATVGNAPIDAIQEFRTVSTNPGADDGRSSGGQIMLVTKGGTNEFHGSLREYNRTAATAANTFFNNKAGIDKPQLTRNQFGGSIGGPVDIPHVFKGKDKLFFFFDYEGRRDAQGFANLRIVPLDNFRNGNLAYLNNNPGCPTNARLNTRPDCISMLSPADVAGLDPQGVGPNQALLSFLNGRYPAANDLTAGDGINTGGFRFNSPSHRADNTYTARVDYNISGKQKVFGRFNIARLLQTDTMNTVAQQFPGDPESGQIIDRDYSFVIGHTYTISSSLVNQATFGITRSGLNFAAPFAPTFPNIFGTTNSSGGSFGGGFGISAPFADISTQTRQVPVPTIRDDFSWARGSHNMEFGVSIKPIRQESSLINDFNFANIGLGGSVDTLNDSLRPANIGQDLNQVAINNYDAAYAFLLGRYASISTNYNYDTAGNVFQPGTGKKRDYRYNEYEVYAQDSWRVRNGLTVSYGLRWQYYPAPYEANGFQSAATIDALNLFVAREQNAAVGGFTEPLLTYNLIGNANDGRPFYKPDRKDFAPRLSLAWNPSFKDGLLGKVFGERKTVIRTGASIVYDRTGGALTFIQDQATYLFDSSASIQYGGLNANDALLNNPRFTNIGSLPAQNIAPTITRPATPFVDNGMPIGNAMQQTNYAIDSNYKTPYSIQYSFGIQRELPKNFILEVSYVGRQARRLFTEADAAQIVNYKDPISGQLMLSAFNGLQKELQSGVQSDAVTPQPWFEDVLFPGGTAAVAGSFNRLIRIGDTGDTIQALNQIGALPANIGLSGQFSTNAYVTNLGSSSYNGLLASLRKRFSKGLEFDFNYTYSHSLDNQSSVANTVFGGLICDLTNLRACRGPSDFDISHLINVNGIYELPFGAGKAFGAHSHGLLNAIIGGWQVGGIFTYRSGLPFNLMSGAFPVSFVNEAAAVLNSSNTSALQQNIHNASDGTIQFFQDQAAALAAVSFPEHGGNGNRNILRGPGFWNVDTSFLKNFRLPWSDKQRLQFRWESYNAFNHNAFALPSVTDIGAATLGQITSTASTPREMQFALRFEF